MKSIASGVADLRVDSDVDWLPRTAQSSVTEYLRRRVLKGGFPPGTRFPQSEIAAQLGVSTTPVREALRQLVTEGLLDGDPRRGVTIHQVTAEELRDLYDMRMVLEPLAMSAAVNNVTERGVAHLQALVDRMQREADPTQWADFNTSFHKLLAEVSMRPLLSSHLAQLRDLSALYIVEGLQALPERIQAANAEHAMILDAVRSHDAERAMNVERTHLQHTLNLGLELLARLEAAAR